MSKQTDELIEAVHVIATIIHEKLPLKLQDDWLEEIIDRGMWKPEENDE